jgi:hypothetical protein
MSLKIVTKYTYDGVDHSIDPTKIFLNGTSRDHFFI